MPINYNPRIVTDGLVLYVDAANTKSYPTSGGTTWTDMSGRGNNGTLVNGVAQDIGFLNFDGTDDYVNAPLTKTATCTFSCWARTTTLAGYPMLFNAGPDGSGPDLWFYLGNIYWNTWDGAANPFATTPASVTNGNYHYYVVVNDASSNTKLYYDGVLLGTAAYRSAAGTTNLTMGGTTNTYMWNGNISNFTIHNRALSAAEIQQNYNALSSRTFLGSSLNPLSSPVQAQSLGVSAGNYYFKSGSMSSAQLLEYQPNYYESRPFCCVFRSPYRSTATTNKIDLSIPMGGLLVQRDALDLRGAVYWSTPITYTTVLGSGNNTADSGTGYAGSNARRVILGGAGGHGLYNTGQSQCNWGNSTGAIGAGYDPCGTFPNDLVWGTGTASPFYDNRSGTWSHWITWS